jgi:quercetin dioxygenase-like cupin family protein
VPDVRRLPAQYARGVGDVAQEWPEVLDALVAAPDNHRLLLENEHVRVLDTVIAPATTTPLHTHRWPATLYVLTGDDFVRRNEHGIILLDTREAEAMGSGPAFWSPPLGPHTLENVGQAEIRVVTVELKQA